MSRHVAPQPHRPAATRESRNTQLVSTGSRLARAGLASTLVLAVTVAACSNSDDDVASPRPATTPATIAIGALPTTIAVSPLPTAAATVPPPRASPPTTVPLATTAPLLPSPPTTAPPPSSAQPAPVADMPCVKQLSAADTLESIAATASVDIVGLWAENGFVDSVEPAGLVDLCVDNRLDDISGQPRDGLNASSVRAAVRANVERQQRRLNELFAPYGTQPIAVDGISGPITGQHLCAARLSFGLPTSVNDMEPGSDEQRLLLSGAPLPTPPTPATESDRWALIDRTCQMMFIGAGPSLVFVFPTSTGSEGFETRDQDRAAAFRFNPATDNGGWHNSNEYPVGVDNPLNGNLYKPIYFDLGQAIHGALTVPPTPQSKGCARLSVADQTTLLAWLGLAPLRDETWVKNQINLTVSVQGQFVGRPTEPD